MTNFSLPVYGLLWLFHCYCYYYDYHTTSSSSIWPCLRFGNRSRREQFYSVTTSTAVQLCSAIKLLSKKSSVCSISINNKKSTKPFVLFVIRKGGGIMDDFIAFSSSFDDNGRHLLRSNTHSSSTSSSFSSQHDERISISIYIPIFRLLFRLAFFFVVLFVITTSRLFMVLLLIMKEWLASRKVYNILLNIKPQCDHKTLVTNGIRKINYKYWE